MNIKKREEIQAMIIDNIVSTQPISAITKANIARKSYRVFKLHRKLAMNYLK